MHGCSHRRGARFWRALLAIAITTGLLPAVAAQARGPLETVLQDDKQILHPDADNGVPDEEEIRASLRQVRDLGIDRVRITAGWSVLAPDADSATRPELDAADPAAYPQEKWHNLDRAVRLAREAGLEVMLDIAFWAPRWATKADPAEKERLATEVDVQEYARFATAVARRYNGSFTPPKPDPDAPPPEKSPDESFLDALFGGGSSRQAADPPAQQEPPTAPLPAVTLYTIWNEPNHQGFLMPQWVQRDGAWVPRSPAIYRAMVQAAYPAIKQAAPNTTVLIGATASFGSANPGKAKVPGKAAVPPLRFLRELACVDEQLQPISTGDCASFSQVPGDGWSHHPYSLKTTPDRVSPNPDNLPVAATPRLTDTLRRLVAAGRLAPAVANVYMTEYGYETNPPDPSKPFNLEQQAQYLPWAEFIASRDPAVKMWPQFLLRDLPGDQTNPTDSPTRPFGDWQSGLYFHDGRPKPAVEAFRAPAFAQCVRAGQVMVWGRVRGRSWRGTITVEERDPATGAWTPLPLATSGAPRAAHSAAAVDPPGEGFIRYAPWRPGAAYRLRWTQPQGGERTGPAVRPLPRLRSGRRRSSRRMTGCGSPGGRMVRRGARRSTRSRR